MARISKKDQIRRITICAVLSALSLVLMITIRFPIFPSAAFYEMEFSDVPILICSGLFGPVYAIVSLFVVCLIQALTVSAASGFIGFVMHFLSSGLMIITLYYLRKAIKGIKGVIASSLLGIVVMTLVMIPMNMWLVGEFMGIDIKGFVEGFLIENINEAVVVLINAEDSKKQVQVDIDGTLYYVELAADSLSKIIL